MQDKDLYIKFICSNLHLQNIFHTSKTIHKMKFFQISIVKSIYWLKKKIITWYNAFPIAKKKLEKNWRKKFKYVIHSSTLSCYTRGITRDLSLQYSRLVSLYFQMNQWLWANILVKHNNFMLLWSSSLLFP